MNFYFTVIDIYQEWAGPTVAFEDIFLKLKRNLTQTEYLLFYSANCENVESLKRYRSYCEPLLLFYGSNTLVHIQHQMNAPSIEKCVEEQLHKEVQVIKENRKREAIDDYFSTKLSEKTTTSNINGVHTKDSFSRVPLLYKIESLSLRSLLMNTAEKIDETHWLHAEPYELEVALFVMKPDLVANNKKDEIIDHLGDNGFIIHASVDKLLNDEDLIKIFKPNSDNLSEFIRFMVSGPSTYMIVSKGYTGRSTSDDLRTLIGSHDPDVAKEINPKSLAAIYGTDVILNGFYSSPTNNEALKEIQIVFPHFHQPIIKGKSVDEYVQKTATFCILGPAQVQSKKEAIMQSIIEHEFEIRYEKSHTFRPDEVESFYIKHRNDDYFNALVEAYTAGPCLLLYIAKENCVVDFINILGSFSRDEFSQQSGTLRHDFDDVSIPVTTIHGSESIIDARKELEQFFPYQQTLAIIKPGLTQVQSEGILKRLNSNGYTIMAKEIRLLTRDCLGQIYARHRGLPWYNDFIQFMSSGVCQILILAREDAVQALREMMGPVDPVRAKTDAPESIRAIYGLDIMRNGLHASSNNKHAREEIRLLFPDYEFMKNRPVSFHSNTLLTAVNHDHDHVFMRDTDDFYCLESHEFLYEFMIHTLTNGNESDESAVLLTLIGKQTETRKFLLQYADNTIQPLKSNKTDIFRFVDQNIGIPKLIKFSHDGRGFPDNWSLSYVEVTVPHRNKIFKFDINEVITEERAKIGYSVTDSIDIEPKTNGNCAIIIQTGCAKYAHTLADCSILLSGSQGVYSFQLRRSLTNRVPFQNRYRDIFLVDVDEQLDDIEYVVLEHNNENSAPAWFVDFLIVKLLTNEKEYFIPIFRWLSIGYLDGKTKITLSTDAHKMPTNESIVTLSCIPNNELIVHLFIQIDLLESRPNVVRYEIYIVTGSMYDAATSSPVWITIHGTKGSILNKYLEIAENESYPFECDNHDLFILYDTDIGEIDKLILGHESIENDQGWFVESIAIHVPTKTYQSETYTVKKWLNSKRIDGIPLVEIQIRKPRKVNRNTKRQQQPVTPSSTINAETDPISTYETSYTVYILTEKFQTDMNNPKIFIDLINETTSTNYMRLHTPTTMRDSLSNDVLGIFKASGANIENIKSIRLFLHTPDQITHWQPRFIIVLIDTTQQLFQFENAKQFQCSDQSECSAILIQLNTIQLTDSRTHSNHHVQSSIEEVQNNSTDESVTDVPSLEIQLGKIKTLYANETGKPIIDRRDLTK